MDRNATPALDRVYRFVKYPAETPKGAQRRITLDVMKAAEGPLPVREIAKRTEAAGLTATAGVLLSTSWHLHQCKLLGLVEAVNPTSTPTPSIPDAFVLAGVTEVKEHVDAKTNRK